jgi:hypothetical protein
MTPVRPPIRNCPFCRIAMVASQSGTHGPMYDEFRCLRCDTVIRFERTNGRDLPGPGVNEA